jgi:Skp family chaperone for outer membrane proteins
MHWTHCRCFPPPPALAPYRSVAEAVHLGTSDAPGCTAEEGVSGAFAFGLAAGAAPVTSTDVTATDVTVGGSSEVLSPHPHQALAVPLQSAQAQQQQLRQQQQQQLEQDQQSSVYSHDSSDEADARAAVAQQQQQQDGDSSQQQQQQQQRSFARGAQGSRQELMEQLARAASEQGVSESDAIAWIIERMEAENQVTLYHTYYYYCIIIHIVIPLVVYIIVYSIHLYYSCVTLHYFMSAVCDITVRVTLKHAMLHSCMR